MERRPAPVRATFLGLFMVAQSTMATGSSGCERGCLTTWLGEGAGGGAPEGAGGVTPSSKRVDLTGTDCSDGLLRCVGGAVQASRLAHLSYPCGSPGREHQAGCTCPWDLLSRCRSGCVEEGLEAAGPADAGAQLCRPELPIARPIQPSDIVLPEICATEGFTCVESVVRLCERVGRPVRALGRCLHGCQPGIAVDHGEMNAPDGALPILCRRDDAERR